MILHRRGIRSFLSAVAYQAANPNIAGRISRSLRRLPRYSGLLAVMAMALRAQFPLPPPPAASTLQFGKLFGWGLNVNGQLCSADFQNKLTPNRVLNLNGVVAVSAAFDMSLALTSDGHVLACGRNDYGQLGAGYVGPDVSVPVQVANLSNVVAIAAGFFRGLALDSNGSVWAWGVGGEIGDNTEIDRLTPVRVVSCSDPNPVGRTCANPVFLSNIVAIAANGYYYGDIALRSDGTVWTWGQSTGNYATQVLTQVSPSRVPLSNIIAIAEGDLFSLALDANNQVWAWGANADGQLGNGNTTRSNLAILVSALTGLFNVQQIAAGRTHSLALDGDGQVWAWGDDRYGQLGIPGGSPACQQGNQYPCSSFPLPVMLPARAPITTIAAGLGHSLALDASGQVYSWGLNSNGQLDLGSPGGNVLAPTNLTNINSVSAIAAGGGHTFVVQTQANAPATGAVMIDSSPVKGASFITSGPGCDTTNYYTTPQTLVLALSPTAYCQITLPSQSYVASKDNLQYVFAGWSDNTVSNTRKLTAPGTYTALFSQASGQFVDTTTQGNWPGKYGHDGWIIANNGLHLVNAIQSPFGSNNQIPMYATVIFHDAGAYTWQETLPGEVPRNSALLKTPTTQDRIASAFYAANSAMQNTFSIELTLTGGSHQATLYLLDYDTDPNKGDARTETISILDANNNNAILFASSISGFHDGKYLPLIFPQGHYFIRVNATLGIGPVVSGLFFDPPPGTVAPPTVSISPPPPGPVSGTVTIKANAQSSGGVIQSVQFLLNNAPLGSPVTSSTGGIYSFSWNTTAVKNGTYSLTASATDSSRQTTTSAPVMVTVSNPANLAHFAKIDTTTLGCWQNLYALTGQERIAGDPNSPTLPAVTFLGQFKVVTLSSTPNATNGLVLSGKPCLSNGLYANRIEMAYVDNTPPPNNNKLLQIDVNFSGDTLMHQVALYLLDFDHQDRNETITFVDGDNQTTVLDTPQNATNFPNGEYLIWNIKGHVIIQVKNNNGAANGTAVSGLFFDIAK